MNMQVDWLFAYMNNSIIQYLSIYLRLDNDGVT